MHIIFLSYSLEHNSPLTQTVDTFAALTVDNDFVFENVMFFFYRVQLCVPCLLVIWNYHLANRNFKKQSCIQFIFASHE